MALTKSFSVTLKYAINDQHAFTSIQLNKGRSQVPESVLEIINHALRQTLIEVQPVLQMNESSEEKRDCLNESKQHANNPDIACAMIQTKPIASGSHCYPVQQFRTTVAIGHEAEQTVLNHLLKISLLNHDFEVDDTSNLPNHGDLAVRYKDKRICIEVKSYQTRVPQKEIAKYRKSLSLSEYDAGIMIQVNPHGFAMQERIGSPIDIRFDASKPSAYLTAVDMDIIYPVINLLINNIKIANDETKMETNRKSLISIHDKVLTLRKNIDAQRKSITALETVVEDVIKLSVVA